MRLNKLHPLLNQNSPHYTTQSGMPAIVTLERRAYELYGDGYLKALQNWAECTAIKYELRAGKKGEAAEDEIKRKTYKDYSDYCAIRAHFASGFDEALGSIVSRQAMELVAHIEKSIRNEASGYNGNDVAMVYQAAKHLPPQHPLALVLARFIENMCTPERWAYKPRGEK